MPKQILLVDDSVTIQRVVELTFAHETDYKVIAAKSHDEGLAKARDLKPDIILADAGMQGKTGYDLCATLRADGGLASTPILILTGNFSPYDEGRGTKAGADGYVVKPFETQALIDKVADAINRKGGRAASPVAAAPVAAAPAPVPPPPSRKDDSLEISIE
ncbi:MAG: response regulator receiver protein, partial [Myxococcales bacterium]|nr:response regulator receiver protein [Myxococcales bacterium]